MELKGIRKVFPGVIALKRVDLTLFPGCIHALVGENGAGKSTLLKIIAGELQPDGGQILLEGRPQDFRNPRSAQRAGIALIHQEPLLCPDLSVVENIFLGRLPVLSFPWKKGVRLVNFPLARRIADQILQELNAGFSSEEKVASLGPAGRQIVEIARSLSFSARLLILDEPTASLTAEEAERLFNLLRRLRERGTAILYVSHRLQEVFALADEVTVLRDGESVFHSPISQVEEGELIQHIVGRPLEALFPHQPQPVKEEEPPVLSVRGLTRKGVFEEISFDLRRGEILGFAGLVGAGRTEVARCLYGLDPFDQGTILLGGERLVPRSPSDALKRGLVYLSEDRQQEGLVLGFPIRANITLSILDRVSRWGVLDFSQEERIARDYVSTLDIRPSEVERLALFLSGGNQQKVVLGRVLAVEPQVLILDEPTRGIDIGAKAEIHRLMDQLVARRKALLLISSDLPELIAMADRILVMRNGRIVGEVSREEATQEAVIALALGKKGDSPPSSR